MDRSDRDTARDTAVSAVFSALVGPLDYPMLIVTAATGEERAGCLVGFSAQCSIRPPRFMVWLSDKNHTLRTARGCDHLGVHFLDPSHRHLAELFGGQTGDTTDKFSRCRWDPGPGGVPLLSDCRRWFVGRIAERFDSGDHVAFMLEPIAGEAGPWSGQLGFQAVRGVRPGHPA